MTWPKRGRGVIMTMGKGGVGKTTVAAAIATELARRGFKCISAPPTRRRTWPQRRGTLSGLHVSRIDPQAETRAYVEQVMATAGKDLDASGRALLEEDLRSPCTEEIAVFRAFARTVAQGEDAFVVLDTAPTGHTLLLLDATEAYHREVARKASDMPEEVLNLLPRLRDASFTRVLSSRCPKPRRSTKPPRCKTTCAGRRSSRSPGSSTRALRRAARAIRCSWRAGADEAPLHPRSRRAAFSKRTALVPWVAEEPVGPEKLRQLFHNHNSITDKD